MTLHGSRSFPYAHFSRNVGQQSSIDCFICDEIGLLHRMSRENALYPRPVPIVPTDIELTSQAPGPLNVNTCKAISWR